MDSLLCDEVWLTTHDHDNIPITNEDCEQAFSYSLEEEVKYMPRKGYMDRLMSCNIFIPRFRAMHWLIKSRTRLNLSHGTLFIAANCFDRFLSINQCQVRVWKFWTIELLSVACLSIATKYNETSTLTLHEIQMEDLDHSFQSSTIQRMELMLLSALNWKICSTTAYSYVETMVPSIDSLSPHCRIKLTTRVNELLLRALLDYKFVEIRPWKVAVSALQCTLEELFSLTFNNHIVGIYKLIPVDKDDADDIVRCKKMMEMAFVDPFHKLARFGNSYYCPSSPVTVLLTERRIQIYDRHVDLSVFEKGVNSETGKMKRKRDDDEQ